jgi:ribonuclease Z
MGKSARQNLAEMAVDDKKNMFRNKLLRVTILGTASGAPTRKRGMPSIAVKYDDLLLWDCGEGCQMNMMRDKIGSGSIKAVFLTHLHIDHFLGVFGLVNSLGLARQEKMHIFAPDGFQKLMDAIVPTMEIRYPFFATKRMRVGEIYFGDQYAVSAFSVNHRTKESFGLVFTEQGRVRLDTEKTNALGFSQQNYMEINTQGETIIGEKRIGIEDVLITIKGRKIVYSGDTVYDERIAEIAEGADLLIHEATYTEEFAEQAAENGHTTAKGAATIAKKAGVEKLMLTHFSRRCKNEELGREAREIFENTVVAEDGMKIDIELKKDQIKEE